MIGDSPAFSLRAPEPSVAPLSTGFAQGSFTWLIVPMGHLSDPLNTFWQLFERTSSSDWTTATPPGVADNGGLVITNGSLGSLIAGFVPSQYLTFSPLSVTADGGRAWSAAYFPAGLLSVPDALAANSVGEKAALGGSRGGELFQSGQGDSQWHGLTTITALRESRAGAPCGVAKLTATALSPNGDPLVGTACRRPGVLGLYEMNGARPESITVVLPSALSGGSVSVLRLVSTQTGLAVLLAGSQRSGRRVFVAGWMSGDSSALELSAPLVEPTRATLLATGTTAAGGVFVLSQPARRASPELADVSPTTGNLAGWDVLPSPPSGTVGAAFSFGRIDAVTVHSSTLKDFVLDENSANWVQSQVIHLSIQYGSSK